MLGICSTEARERQEDKQFLVLNGPSTYPACQAQEEDNWISSVHEHTTCSTYTGTHG